ncbi:MAG: hypothetical protein LBR66_04340 [Candidatus Symbiothrix sp.]|nr:hypothetical protein [Candidatus Symbiothrix sp.]
MLFACTFASFTGKAQVTIGTLQDPHRAALLHLRSRTDIVPTQQVDTLGTKLTVVALPDTAHLNLGDALIYNLDVDPSATGMVVYNITDDPCGRGLIPCLYVWDGATWHPAGCPFPECTSATFKIISATICSGDTYNDNGFNESMAGTYSRTIAGGNAAGGDSTITLILTVTPIVIPALSISISSCTGTTATLTATPTNGGISPTYQWMNKSTAIASATTATYTLTYTDTDSIWCVMTPSSEVCISTATAVSNKITFGFDNYASAVTTYTNVMYDFQSQDVYAYDSNNGTDAPTQYQWQVKLTTGTNWVDLPASVTGSQTDILHIPVNFQDDPTANPLLSGTGYDTNYADTFLFRCQRSADCKMTVQDDGMEILFINTKNNSGNYLAGYGEEDGVKYITLKKGNGGLTVPGGSSATIKMALLNLGQSDGNNAEDLGDFYQWGRVPDGHQKTVWTKHSTFKMNTILPMSGGANNTSMSIPRPTTTTNGTYSGWSNEMGNNFDQVTNATEVGYFLTYEFSWSSVASLYRWGQSTQSSGNRNPNKTANDPCPSNWKVPSRWQFIDIYDGDGTSDAPLNETWSDAINNTWTWRSPANHAYGGAVITNSNGAKVFLPAAGFRDDYLGQFNGNHGGFYWSSTAHTSTSVLVLGFSISQVISGTNIYISSVADGHSVRCVKE